jgi:hypothetical protein
MSKGRHEIQESRQDSGGGSPAEYQLSGDGDDLSRQEFLHQAAGGIAAAGGVAGVPSSRAAEV